MGGFPGLSKNYIKNNLRFWQFNPTYPCRHTHLLPWHAPPFIQPLLQAPEGAPPAPPPMGESKKEMSKMSGD